MSASADLNQKLMEVSESGNLDEVRRLVEAGADVNFTTHHHLRPLLMAVFYRHTAVAAYLIAKGADPNYDGFSEGTALITAASSGDAELTALLLESGADPNLALPRSGETALHAAAFCDQAEMVRLLVRAGADVNRQANSGAATDSFDGGAKVWAETPLHFAAAYAGVATIEALLASGADRAIPNAHGETALAYAGRHRRPREIVQLLK